MSSVLSQWNEASEPEALQAMLACCASHRWAKAMLALRPVESAEALFLLAEQTWQQLSERDWLEAFAAHPRIGQRKPVLTQPATATQWSRQEQAQVHQAAARTLQLLAEGNEHYEQRFGFTYIVCATGKSAEEMLILLNQRLHNSQEEELREAAKQQQLITAIRLRKWLTE